MRRIDHAISLVCPGETALAIMTRGDLLTIRRDGRGLSGNWYLNRDKASKLRKVIIYLRRANGFNHVYQARLVRIADPINDPDYIVDQRWAVEMADVRLVGVTNRNWPEFADTGQKEIRYVTRP